MKKLCLLLLSVFLLPFFLFGCSTDKSLNLYKIEAVFDDVLKTLDCSQEVTYVNNSSNSLQEICFFLYANAFDEGQATVPSSYTNKAYPNGKSFGRIEIKNISQKEKDSNFAVNENKNILTVSLDKTLFPDEKTTINMNYTVALANINHRLGYGEDAVNFGNFFPIACVYQEGLGFVKNQFSASGDPFFSDVSDFDVKITYPKEYVLASTGTQTEISNSSQKISKCEAKKVRDFCFVLSTKFQKTSAKVGETEVIYYFFDDEKAAKHIETAVKALTYFQETFGSYPYGQLSVVKTNFCFGGMEYPNLVMISDAIAEEESYNYVIVHEIAHQWWYGLVGSNQYEQSWVDESLTEFSTALFFEMHSEYGIDYDTTVESAMLIYKNFVETYTKINGNVDQSMDRDLSQFETEPEYVNCIYTKGLLLFDCLRSSMSERKFFKCLKDYLGTYIFENSSSEKLIKSFCKSSGINLEKYFESWLEGRVVIK